jgi:hypothetical protein
VVVTVDGKKLVILSVAALMLFYVIVNPADAACTVQQVLGLLEDGANGLFAFTKEFFADI